MHVIATAGHVDHGKSTLVNALTGMEPDRWAEERARGMSIDLGYAWTTLAGGEQLAFVDVPGHRRFVANMLAGVGPVPAVLLVVAADDGWCEQTAEHLAAIEALGVRHGVLAITRADLAEPELAEQEAREHLAGTTLAGIEAVAVSPVAGTGLDELRAALGRLVEALPVPPDRPTRLWIDRSFSIRGAGTIVTGTLTSGTVHVDQELEVVPSGERVRIRGIETLKTPVSEANAVARVALNLRGVKPSAVPRGSALVAPGGWAVVSSFDVRLTRQTAGPGSEAICHLGSLAVTARLRPLGADTARVTLPCAVPLRIGERALLRPPGGSGVSAGITVLDPYPPALRARGAARLRGEQLAALAGTPDLAAEISMRGAVRLAQLERAGALEDGAECPAGALRRADWFVSRTVWLDWRRALVAAADRHALENPLRPGLPLATAVQQVGVPARELIALLVAEEPDLVADHDGVHRADVVSTLPPAAHAALEEVLGHLAEHPFRAREAAELAAAGLTDAHLASAVKDGRLIRLPGAVYLRPTAVEQAVAILRELPQPFTTSTARQALNTTRRVALPLFEELDRRRLTRRVDDQRRAVVG